LKPKEKQKP